MRYFHTKKGVLHTDTHSFFTTYHFRIYDDFPIAFYYFCPLRPKSFQPLYGRH